MLVLIEYVPFGDLLGYLRKSRGLNDTYYKDPDIKPQTSLTSEQLITFAWQIADGMSYLSSKSVSWNVWLLYSNKSGADCLYFVNTNYTVKRAHSGPLTLSDHFCFCVLIKPSIIGISWTFLQKCCDVKMYSEFEKFIWTDIVVSLQEWVQNCNEI